MSKLNKNAKKWVEALKSGKYTQARGLLHNRSREFCCLGVACDLYAREKGLSWFEDCELYFVGLTESGGILPNTVRDWLGLNSGDGGFNGETGLNFLSVMNDNGSTFDEIAKLIESKPKNLFTKGK